MELSIHAALPSSYVPTYGVEACKPGYSHTAGRVKAPPVLERDVIAWDMEGISLSGLQRPQHAVLFGCSAETDNALSGRKLTTQAMLEYIISVGERNPHAIHVGYAFKYDANMLIAGLSERHISSLWKTGRTTWRWDSEFVWSIRMIPGKMFTVTKRWGKRRNTRAKTSVTIYDFFSFFGKSFIKTMEEILGDSLSAEDRDVIAHGKAARGLQTWDDFAEIRHYWEREIVLMRRTFEKFREVMYAAGFGLTQWYGPGALANYINSRHGIRAHLSGVQVSRDESGVRFHDGFPEAVHEASKVAFSGGRFELFQAGRVGQRVYAVDINSAYPYALTHIPSFQEGRWVHTVGPRSVELFGFYRISWSAPNSSPLDTRPQPLFWRDSRGLITYPQATHGWYASPEAAAVQNMPGITIHESWHWDSKSEERPWTFLNEMYETRQRLGKKNVMSMPFKLGPNSLYGKYAQTVGWDTDKMLPPKSHALPVAAWVTSYCRAMLWSVIRQSPSSVIAVETDSVYLTRDPRTMHISLGSALGEWDFTEYDDLIYMQNGMYHTMTDGEWTGVKSRGMHAADFPIETMLRYLDGLRPGDKWKCDKQCPDDCEEHSVSLPGKPRFIGAGAALAMSAPLADVHTSWRAQTRRVALGDTGKRSHHPGGCAQCQEGVLPAEAPHRLLINSRGSDGITLSHPRRLPWEKAHTSEIQEIRDADRIESELLEVLK